MKPLLATLFCFCVQDEDHFGLKAGNEWTYRLSNGATMTSRVTGTAKVECVECAVVETAVAGQNPWSGEQLNEVDTRAEYERHVRGR